MKFLAACLTALLIVAVAEDADKPPTDPALDKLAAAFAEAEGRFAARRTGSGDHRRQVRGDLPARERPVEDRIRHLQQRLSRAPIIIAMAGERRMT